MIDLTRLSFARAVEPFAERGQFPRADLLPIIPPGAKLVSKTAVDAEHLGKIPGRYDFRAGLWSGLPGAWPTVGLTPRVLAQCPHWPTENVGLRAEQFPAVDIDVASEEARDLIEGLANFHLGQAPARTRANAPRALLVYRLTGDEPIRKMRIAFKDGAGVENAVEFLGLGQQYLIAGQHPSGSYYEWREGADLATFGVNGLAKITADDARMFMNAVLNAIIERGWTITLNTKRRGGPAGDGVLLADIEPVLSAELALEALNAIPNTDEVLPLREDIVSVLAGLKAAIGKEALREDVKASAREWAVRHGWADEDYFEAVWASLTHIRVGPNALLGRARKFGWFGDAPLDFPDDAEDTEAKVAAVQEAANEEDTALRALAAKVVYWPAATRFILLGTGEQLPHAALNAYPGLGTMVAPSGASGVKTAANRLVNSGLLRHVAGVTYLPGKLKLVSWTSGSTEATFYNKWINHDVALPANVTDADVAPWLSHFEYLFTDMVERALLLDFLAHMVQRRGEKIRWAPVIIGRQGVGKDMAMRPIVDWLGKTNVRQVEPTEFSEKFVDIYENELCIVQEITRQGKFDLYEKLKAIISGTASDTVTVNIKYQMPYEIPNTANFMFFSNHSDAISISEDDRRFFVIESDAEKKDTAYYRALNNFYKEGGNRAVIAWLLRRELKDFDGQGSPLMTDAKRTMIEESRAPSVRKIQAALAKGSLKDRSVLTAMELLDLVSGDFGLDTDTRKSFQWSNQASRALVAAGWVKRRGQIRLDGEAKRVWCRTAELAAKSNDELRAIYIAEKGSGEREAA